MRAWSRARACAATRSGALACLVALVLLEVLALGGLGCERAAFVARVGAGNFGRVGDAPRPVPNKVPHPFRPDARLAVLWVGHATVLVQMDDKLVLTDPVFTESVGQISPRLVEPGLDLAALPPLDAVIISHMHFDHLSVGTLELLESRMRGIVVPSGGMVYVPDSAVPAAELGPFESVDWDGLRITAAPVDHTGFRYGVDEGWMKESFSGYVLEHRGQTVYFGGDTAYDREDFEATRRRFPRIDLAILPIAPIHPRDLMKRVHMDPHEAVQAFFDLGAQRMLPMHFETFVNSLDAPGEPEAVLRQVMARRGLDERTLPILRIGEQRVLVPR
jgi:L-ascorbate metabolism protein UlaG (beta-lactamase superfamily)